MNRAVHALTGRLGVGKSTVGKMFTARGAKVFSADSFVHQILREDAQIKTELSKRHGNKILDQDQQLDRRALGKIVFSQLEEKDFLEALLLPKVQLLFETTIKHCSEQDLIIYEAPTILKYPEQIKRFKKIILVTASEQDSVNRVKSRDGRSEEDCVKILTQQLSEKKQKEYSDFIIENNGDLQELEKKIDAVYKELLLV